jgi:plastocyanin
MKPTRIWMLYLWLGVLTTGGCASHPPFPESSLSGRIVEVIVGESLAPKDITAKPGDELRWVNQTGDPVDISFVEPLDGRVSCQKGFASAGWGYLFGGIGSKREVLLVATVHGHEYASLCFSGAGTYAYTIKRKTGEAGRAGGVAGTVTIE